MNPPPRFRIFDDPDSACARAADGLARLISERAILGRKVVLGLVAGETILPFFKELIYRHREEGLSLGNVVTFNTDAYVGVDGNHPASMQSFMRQHLFDHVDIPANRIHFPPTTVDPLDARCAKYEASIKRAGGVDYQVLRLRQNGGLGLQHPGIPTDGRTGQVVIEEVLRARKAVEFGGIGKVPTHVVSLGDRRILKSRRIIVLAWGARKAYWVRRVILGPVTPEASATYLQNHPNACFYVDAPAGRFLMDDPEEPA